MHASTAQKRISLKMMRDSTWRMLKRTIWSIRGRQY